MRIRSVFTITPVLCCSILWVSSVAAQQSKDNAKTTEIGINQRVIMSAPVDEGLLEIIQSDYEVLQRALKRIEPDTKNPGPNIIRIRSVELNSAGIVGNRELNWLEISLLVSVVSKKELNDKVWRNKEWQDSVMKAVRQELEETYNRIYQKNVKQQLQKQLSETGESLMQSRNHRGNLDAQIRYHEEQMDIPTSVLEQLLKSSLQQKHQLKMDALAARARSKAITIEMARLSEKSKTNVSEDLVVQQLAKLVKLAEANLNIVKAQQKVSATSLARVHEAETELVRSQVEYERARREVAKSSGSDQLARMSEELSKLTVEIATADAREDAEDESIETWSKAISSNRENQREIDQARAEMKSLQSQIKSLTSQQKRLTSDLESRKPLSITPWSP